MLRLLNFLKLVAVLTALMFAVWWLSAMLLPQGILRPYFARLFTERVGELTFMKILLANLLPFLGVQFMNLFRVERHAGGLFVLPIFWVLYGLLLGTNSFVFAGEPVQFSLSVLWERSGFNELLAYTASYEASREWALWQQRGLWRADRIKGKQWKPTAGEAIYWCGALLLLVLAALREVS